ncbi:extended synaptotagmin-1-like [Rhopilema esculentum]|uniref:extended synaptotagmin-1-like n=1 Tax=Rhopilema esculentum TaxID=499914 RepID=UPI0031D2C47E
MTESAAGKTGIAAESYGTTAFILNISWMLALLLGVWLAGSCGLSFAWIIISCVVLATFFKQRADRNVKRTLARAIANEKAAIKLCPELPSWVNFPDVERAEWLNKVIRQVWPFVGKALDKMLRESVEPVLRTKVPSTLSGIRFDTIRIGDLPPRIGGIKVHTDNLKRSEAILDVDIIYAGDAKIILATKGVKLGVEDLEIRGTLRVLLYPLIPDLPLIGGLTMYFINRPLINFDLTNVLNFLETPGVNTLLRNVIDDAIASFVVLPNKIAISLSGQVNSGELKNRLPDGVLRIKVVEGADLEAKDLKFLGSSGTSDPYITLTIGAEKFSTTIKSSTLNPTWNETFEVLLEESSNRKIDVTAFDRDRLPSRDESLGDKSWALSKVIETGYQDVWLALDHVKSGKIHLQMTWFTLNSSSESVKTAVGTTPSKRSTLTKAVLIVHIDSASNLPRSRHSNSACNPVCKVIVGSTTFKTHKLNETVDPVWEQSLGFLVREPEQQDVKFQLWDHKKDRLLGSLTFKIRSLMNEDDMSLKQSFPLDDCSTNAKLTAKLTLMGLNEPVQPTDEDENFVIVGNEGKEEILLDPKSAREATTPTTEESSGSGENHSPSNKSRSNGSPSNGSPPNVSFDEVFNDSNEFSRSTLDRTGSGKSDASRSRIGTFMRRAKLFSSSSALNDDFRATSPQGEIKIAIVYRQVQKRLVIGVFQARIFETGQNPDDNNNINPYVRIYLLPDRSRSTRLTTDVAKRTCNPEFSETLWYGIDSIETCREKKLDIMLKSETPLLKRAKGMRYELGRAIIDLAKEDLASEEPEWRTLYKVESD